MIWIYNKYHHPHSSSAATNNTGNNSGSNINSNTSSNNNKKVIYNKRVREILQNDEDFAEKIESQLEHHPKNSMFSPNIRPETLVELDFKKYCWCTNIS